MPIRAMVLAAGRGARLHPLTELLPKPLVPVANRPLIAYTLSQLRAASATEVVMNLHHLGAPVRAQLGDGSEQGLRITYSEEETLLGTGGGVVRVRGFLDRDSFFLLNADVLSTVALQRVLAFHRERQAVATMVVRPWPAEGGFTPLEVDADDHLVAFQGVRRPAVGTPQSCMFCGVHVLEPIVFDFLPAEGFASINEQAYTAMLAKGLRICAFWHHGPWFDLGTPSRYLAANCAVLAGRVRLPQLEVPDVRSDGVLVAPGARVDPSARLGPEVSVGEGCTVGPGAEISRAILWPGAHIAPGARLDSVIATPEHLVSVKGNRP